MLRNIFATLTLICASLSIGHAQCWNLVWADEFNSTTLDLTKWSYQTGGSGWGNNELQHYTNRVDNALISGGSLKIIAKEEAYGGNNYTSARIRTLNKADFRYGKIEMYAKLPETQGLWPAFWLLPSENVFGNWPAGGEIDIMEVLGHEPAITYATIHSQNPATGGVISSSTSYTLPSGTFASAFHVFRIEWEPAEIRWYIDNTLIATKTPANLSPWRFTELFHIILNVAVGGNWPGPPNATTIFPQQMEVDYVRVYQKNADLSITGKKKVEPNTSATYTMPDIAGASYAWAAPTGASIASGQGTPQVSVQFGTLSGNVTCSITTSCGAVTATKTVEVTPNMLTNPSFEDDFMHWLNNNHNGSGAFSSFAISSTTPQHLAKKACVNVNQIPGNTWDIQIAQTGLDLVAGTSYRLKFWAQSDAPNKTLSAAIINSSSFTTYKIQTFTVGQAWQEYSFTFTAPATAGSQLNFDFGHSTATFCIDNVVFGKTALIPLPVEITDFDVQINDNNNALVTWAVSQERDISQYAVERSSDAITYQVVHAHAVAAQSQVAQYRFMDKNLPKGTWYYRLRSIDHDGSSALGAAASVTVADDYRLSVFPNPSRGRVTVTQNGKWFESSTIRVYSSIGQLVMSVEAQNPVTELDLSTLPAGVYVVQVGDERALLNCER